MGAQSKERKGSIFAAQRSRAIVQKPRRAKHIRSKNLAIAIWQPWRGAAGGGGQAENRRTSRERRRGGGGGGGGGRPRANSTEFNSCRAATRQTTTIRWESNKHISIVHWMQASSKTVIISASILIGRSGWTRNPKGAYEVLSDQWHTLSETTFNQVTKHVKILTQSSTQATRIWS